MIKTIVHGMLLSGLLLAIGCGDGGAGDLIRKRRSNLETLGAAYRAYCQDHGASPANSGELVEFLQPQAGESKTDDAITALVEGDVTMIFGGQFDPAAQNDQYVIGFEAGVPATGGYVVMGDGQVQLMTVKNFSEADMLPTSGSGG